MVSKVFGVADEEMDLSNRHECPVPGCPSTAEAHHLRDTAHRMEIAELKAKLRAPDVDERNAVLLEVADEIEMLASAAIIAAKKYPDAAPVGVPIWTYLRMRAAGDSVDSGEVTDERG